jgi:hypothetical protein
MKTILPIHLGDHDTTRFSQRVPACLFRRPLGEAGPGQGQIGAFVARHKPKPDVCADMLISPFSKEGEIKHISSRCYRLVAIIFYSPLNHESHRGVH